MRLLITNLLASALLIFGAASAHAFATTMTSNYSNGTVLTTGDTVSVTVNFDSEGAADISLLSVSVLFNDTIMSWDQSASTSPSYALYVSGGKGNQYLVPATTNLTLRTGTSDQILLDWLNTTLPGGNRDQCGNYGPDPAGQGVCGCGVLLLPRVLLLGCSALRRELLRGCSALEHGLRRGCSAVPLGLPRVCPTAPLRLVLR